MHRYLGLIPLIVGCKYTAPVDGPPPDNVISGTAVFGGTGPAYTTIMTAWWADNPPPPAGLGRSPVVASTVGAKSFTGSDQGLQSGDFYLTHIPDGQFVVTAIMDVDGNFNPFVSVLAGATCGDWLGIHTSDLTSGIPGAVSVSGGQWLKNLPVLLGIHLTLQRPVFELVNPTIGLSDVLGGRAAPLFRVRTAAVNTAFQDDLPLVLGPTCGPGPTCTPTSPACICDGPTIQPCGTAIYTLLEDEDQDGVVDPYPDEAEASEGLLDIWPRVFVEYTGSDLGTFEYEGKEYPERWDNQGFPLAAEIFQAAGAGMVSPGEAAATLFPPGAPFPVQELSVTFSPVFLHYWEGATGGVDANGPYDFVFPTDGDLQGVPTGTWNVTLISFTGQTWSVPNEIAEFGLPALDPTVDQKGQGIPLQVNP